MLENIDRKFLKDSRYFNMNDGVNLLKSGGNITLSWGISLITEIKEGGEPRAMAFNVNGMKFQGTVVLSVNFMDYYEARFYQEGKLVKEMNDIFVTDVISMVDEYVEKQEDYVY
jgi:hypothetical protein